MNTKKCPHCGLTKTNDLSGKKSDETKSKIKLAKTGTYHSDFTRDKISNTKKSQNLKLSDEEKYIKSINSKLSRKVLKIETNEIWKKIIVGKLFLTAGELSLLIYN